MKKPIFNIVLAATKEFFNLVHPQQPDRCRKIEEKTLNVASYLLFILKAS